MRRIPHARDVVRAIRSVRAAAKKALKGLNQIASQRMAKGDYVTVEALTGKGRELRKFQVEVDELRKRWREVSGMGDRGAKPSVTPMWVYYQPILQALAQVGGECRRIELETHVERLMRASLQAGDKEVMARGRERWRVMVQRARKHLISEGWIEDQQGPVWKITDSGRRTAQKPICQDISTHK